MYDKLWNNNMICGGKKSLHLLLVVPIIHKTRCTSLSTRCFSVIFIKRPPPASAWYGKGVLGEFDVWVNEENVPNSLPQNVIFNRVESGWMISNTLPNASVHFVNSVVMGFSMLRTMVFTPCSVLKIWSELWCNGSKATTEWVNLLWSGVIYSNGVS